jgi:cystine transport system substrate-binding protein
VSARRARALTLAAAAVLLGAGLAGCGGHVRAAAAQTPSQRFAQLLGHRPTGIAATIAARGILVVGEDAEFAPQSSVDSTGAWSGFDVDVAQQVATLLDVNVEIRELDWARVPAALKGARYDVAISPIATDPAPAKGLAFTAPYAYSTAQIVVRAGSAPITTLAGLSGKAVGASAATTYQRFLEAASGVQVELYTTDADAVADVGDGSLAGAMTADTTAATMRAGGAAITAAGPGFFCQPQAFAVEPGQSDLISLLDSAISSMRASGELARLSRRWYHGLDVSARPAGVPTFTKALAMLGAGTYPSQ